MTAPPPIRGFIKRQDFVDLSLLEFRAWRSRSVRTPTVSPSRSHPTRSFSASPGGLTLSSVDVTAERAPTAVRPIFDIDEWRKNQDGEFIARQDALIAAAARGRAGAARAQARLDLADFYMSRGLYPEAKGETEVLARGPSPKVEESVVR